MVLACRDLARGAEAVRRIIETTGNENVRVMELDVSSMASVRAFARAFAVSRSPAIQALVCNAGISRANDPTVDGIDPVFATNHLGHFLLTELLLPAISPGGRVLSVSSDMHHPPGPALRWPGAELLASPKQSASVHRQRYSFSKLCNLYFIHELSRRLRAEHSTVSAAAFNPGLMTETNFATMPRLASAALKRMFASRVGSLATSSTALARLATDGFPDIDDSYFDRTDSAPTRSSELSYDAVNALELWEVSSRLSKLTSTT